MDFELMIKYVVEFAYVISIFTFCLYWAIFLGRQSLINVLTASYIAILLFSKFPFAYLFTFISTDTKIVAATKIAAFLLLTYIITLIIKRVMPLEFLEGKFQNLSKKFFIIAGMTILYTCLSFTILPVTDLIPINNSLQSIFSESYIAYGALVAPLVLLALQ